MVIRIVGLFMLLGTVMAAPASLAAVSAQLSAQTIDELETVRLTIKITETRQSQTLDLSGLEADFHVMNTNTVSQSRFLNGRGQSWVDYQITLQPKRTGTLTIPSITVGGERTPTLELTVQPLSAQTRQVIDDLVFFENTVSANTIYVQSQLVLTRKLLYSQGVQLYSDLPGAPEIADAVVLSLGETSSGTTERNGKTYGIVEQNYAIFPETSGTFTVPGISITASVRLLEGNRVSRKGVRVSTSAEQITVLPVPAAYPAEQPWLPAQNVTLFDVVSPESTNHQVGDTLTHELLVYIEGNIGSIAPPLALALSDTQFRVYPQAPVIEDNADTATVKGSRLQTNSIVPLQPGSLHVPVTRLVWWDTINEQVRTSETKARTLQVSGVAVAPVTPPVTGQTTEHLQAADADSVILQELEWRTVLTVGGGILGCIALLAGIRLFWRSPGSWRQRKRLPSAHRQLQHAFTSLDAARIHAALSIYLAQFYGCPRHLALARFSESEGTATAVEHLSRYLYAAHDGETHDGIEDFNLVVKRLRDSVAQLGYTPPRPHKDVLPELYPQTS